MGVYIARGLERRLERLFEGSAKRVFSGQVHPSELAERIAREADLARFEHQSGPATANQYLLTLNPKDVKGDTKALIHDLERELSGHAAEAGLRLEGPPLVTLETSERVSPGQAVCTHRIVAGPQPAWGHLVGDHTKEIGPNRVVVGRSSEADIVLASDEVSRRHALVWRSGGSAWIKDLNSANGTSMDLSRIGNDPIRLEHGSMLIFGSSSYRFLER